MIALGQAATAIELRLSGMKHVKQADALAAQLGKLAGVESARVRVVAADATLIDLKGKALSMAALEEGLLARGFVITRRTRDQLEARLDETGAARRTLTIARFRNATGKKDLDWIEQLLPEVIETELANSKYFVPGKARPTLDPDKPVVGEAHGELVLLGKVESAGPQLRLSVRAVRPKDGAVLATAQSFGAEGALAELGKDLVWKLDGPLYQKVFGKPSLEDYVAPLSRRTHVPAAEGKVAAASKPPAARGPQVRIERVKFGDLFPSRLGHYARHPLGKITLRNDGDEESRDARVTIDLGEQPLGLVERAAPRQLDRALDRRAPGRAVDAAEPDRVGLGHRGQALERRRLAAKEGVLVHGRSARVVGEQIERELALDREEIVELARRLAGADHGAAVDGDQAPEHAHLRTDDLERADHQRVRADHLAQPGRVARVDRGELLQARLVERLLQLRAIDDAQPAELGQIGGQRLGDADRQPGVRRALAGVVEGRDADHTRRLARDLVVGPGLVRQRLGARRRSRGAVALAQARQRLGEQLVRLDLVGLDRDRASERATRRGKVAARDADAAQARQRVEVVRRQRDRRAERAARGRRGRAALGRSGGG